MFIKLTNAAPSHLGKPIIIKKDIIISIFEVDNKISDEEIEVSLHEKVTTVFCGPLGNWNVKETVEEVYKLL
jgi:hypothetical protein